MLSNQKERACSEDYTSACRHRIRHVARQLERRPQAQSVLTYGIVLQPSCQLTVIQDHSVAMTMQIVTRVIFVKKSD